MTEIQFTIPGKAVPKGRSRSFLQKGKIINTTPPKTRNYENLVKLCAYQIKPEKPLDEPLALYMVIYVQRPKKPKSEYPITRPDIDNYIKSVFDGCNEILFTDDKLIVDLSAVKRYSVNPRIEVKIKTLT